MKASIPGDVTFEFELAFEDGPHFSGPFFGVSEGYFAVIIGEEAGLGLLRPSDQAQQYDRLGTVPLSSDGSVLLKIVLVGGKMRVFANDRRVASRQVAIFAEPKSLGGFYVSVEHRILVDRVTG